jgi:hypothetical protein
MTSEIIAKFLGLYMLLMAFIWLTRKKQFEGSILSAIRTDGTWAISGGINMIVGLIVLLFNHIWEFSWLGLITLIGYLSIIQGMLRLGFPDETRKMIVNSIQKYHWVWIAFLVVIGGFLTYHGFQS